jgi:hypothetical protein
MITAAVNTSIASTSSFNRPAAVDSTSVSLWRALMRSRSYSTVWAEVNHASARAFTFDGLCTLGDCPAFSLRGRQLALSHVGHDSFDKSDRPAVDTVALVVARQLLSEEDMPEMAAACVTRQLDTL